MLPFVCGLEWYILKGAVSPGVSLVAAFPEQQRTLLVEKFSSHSEALTFCLLAGLPVENARLNPLECWVLA